MNAKLKLASILCLACFLVSSLMFVHPFQSQQVMAASQANYGGFLYPWKDDPNTANDNKIISQNAQQGNHNGQEIDFKQGSPGVSFDILAPKDGVVIYANDSSPDTWSGNCSQIAPATNYIVLGHGYKGSGEYSFYTVYYHLKYDSIPKDNSGNKLGPGSFVQLGQKIGTAGKTGYSTGIHLHFVGTDKPVNFLKSKVIDCSGNELASSRQWVTVNSGDTRPVGFEEAGNQWPLLNGGVGLLEDPSNNKPISYNWTGIQKNDCNPTSSSTKVALYNHINFGGECVSIPDPENGYFVPGEMHISSIFLNPDWINSTPNAYKSLTLWDGDPLYPGVTTRTIFNSTPDLGAWNDRVKYVHNASHNDALWLLEESYAPQGPLEVDLHFRVANDPDFSAWRVCFDGQNCQENAAPINELYYTWNTYGYADGNHIISVQYRRTSDNNNWDNADYYEASYYLNPNRSTYAPCGSEVNGAKLESGSDCIIVTSNIADLAFAGWGDRSDLTVTAKGYDVLVFNSSNFEGAPYYIKNSQTKLFGGNVSSIELRVPLGTSSYVPEEPLGVDSNTIDYFTMNEGSGSKIYDSAGSLIGTLVGSASFAPGRFDQGVFAPNPPEGSGVNLGAVNFGSPLTTEMVVKFNTTNNDQSIATQLGGGGNTGYNKWLIGLVGGRFRVWSCYIHGCHEGYSLEDVQPGKWYYLMFTYDGATTAKFYVDSILQTTITMDGTMSPGATTFELGQGEGIFGCNCTIDDVRISNIARIPLGPPAPTPTPAPTATPDPTPTATQIPSGTLVNSFEAGVEGWWANTGTEAVGVSQSGLHATVGSHSLQVEFDHSIGNAYYQRTLPNSEDWSPYQSISLDVWSDQGGYISLAAGTGSDWDWNLSSSQYISSGGSTVTYDLSSDWNGGSGITDIEYIRYIGILFAGTQPGTGYLYVDNLRLVGASSPTPTDTPPTPTPVPTSTPVPTATVTQVAGDDTLYNFENGTTQSWMSYEAVSSLANSTALTYMGTHSLCANSTFSDGVWSNGFVAVDQTLTTGNVITAHMYMPSDGPNTIGASLYLQDANWGWYESSSQLLTPGQWTDFTWDLSSLGFVTPTHRLGIHLGGNSAYQGCIYIDSVDVTQ